MKIIGAYIVMNEFLTCIYYAVLSFTYVNSMHQSVADVSTMCIKIIIVALVLNIVSSFALSCQKVYQWYRKKRNNIVRTFETAITHYPEVQNTKNLEND